MQDLHITLAKIHSLTSWEDEWKKSGENDITNAVKSNEIATAKILYKKATAKFYLASLFSSSKSNEVMLFNKMRKAYQSYGKLEEDKFEHISINFRGQQIYGYFRHPNPPHKVPLVLIIPALGAIKEEFDIVSEYFLKNNMATIIIDVPGFGETTGNMTLDFEENCRAVISYLSERNDILADKIISMGISLGAYWTMKLASKDRRLKLAIGISTPALYHEQWNKLPKHYWTYFQQYFGTKDLQSTREITEQLTLSGVMEKIECPVLLIHGKKDKISHHDAMEIFSNLVKASLTTKVYPDCGHGCFEEYEDILPYIIMWSKERLC